MYIRMDSNLLAFVVSLTGLNRFILGQSNCKDFRHRKAKSLILCSPNSNPKITILCVDIHKGLNSVSKRKWQKFTYSRNLLMKSSKDNFIFLLVFHLIMCLMNAAKNFGKIAILKIWELISLGGVKTHFGKLALKWCIFRHEIKIL